MAQKLRDDKIGTLQHSAGNIQMIASLSNPAYLTIGGQQYKITSTLVVALPAMSANTRYQVYAVQSGGVVSLVISQNENSVGPAGYNRWKLVGSLYSNGMSPVAFGSFVNIKGAPRTNTVSLLPVIENFSVSSQTCFWYREGDKVFLDYNFILSGAPTGTLYPNIPTNMTLDSSKMRFASNEGYLGGANGQDGVTQGYTAGLQLGNSTRLRTIGSAGANEWNATIPFSWGTGDTYSLKTLGLPITGWSNTPIEDL
jgi:hypothetical protein